MPRKVDHSAIRTNQAFLISSLLIAFIIDAPLLVVVVSLILGIGTAFPQYALFKQIYKQILKPRGLVQPDVIEDNPEPHNFSQGLGSAFTALSFIFLLFGSTAIGWGLAWLVVGLASLNLFAGFCAGCFLYYQLSKHDVPGFKYQPIQQ